MLIASISGPPIVYSWKGAVIDCLSLAGAKKGDLVVDLGCGNARTLITAVQKFGVRGVGVDRSLYCYLRAKMNVVLSGEGKYIRIIWGDFKKATKVLKEADIVYLYLLNTMMKKMEKWLFESIGSDTKVVSLAFHFDNHQPIATADTVTLGKTTKAILYKRTD